MSKLFPQKKGLNIFFYNLMPFNIQYVIIQFYNKPLSSSVCLNYFRNLCEASNILNYLGIYDTTLYFVYVVPQGDFFL